MSYVVHTQAYEEALKRARAELELIKSEWNDDVQKKFYDEYVEQLFRMFGQHIINQASA